MVKPTMEAVNLLATIKDNVMSLKGLIHSVGNQLNQITLVTFVMSQAPYAARQALK